MDKGEEEHLNLNSLAVEFKSDLQELFDSPSQISNWEFCGRFTEHLKTEGVVQIQPDTVYRYLTSTTLPFEVGIHLLSYLAKEPYIKRQEVKKFIKKWVNPVNQAIDRVRESAMKEKTELLEKAKEYDEFL